MNRRQFVALVPAVAVAPEAPSGGVFADVPDISEFLPPTGWIYCPIEHAHSPLIFLDLAPEAGGDVWTVSGSSVAHGELKPAG